MYTPLEQAKDEIWRRRTDCSLRLRVAKFLGDIPIQFTKEPKAFLNRDVASPDNEFRQFVKMSKKIGLAPLVSEYLEDKFVSLNPDKMALAKMAIYRGFDKKNNVLFKYKSVIDCNKYDGKNFSEIMTLWGEAFSEFHHRLLALAYPNVEVIDNSKWLKSKGNRAQEFYIHELALCICHGVLFEDFIASGHEKGFCEEVVLPTFNKLVDMFDCKPLIVSLLSRKGNIRCASDIYWRCYSINLEDEICNFSPSTITNPLLNVKGL